MSSKATDTPTVIGGRPPADDRTQTTQTINNFSRIKPIVSSVVNDDNIRDLTWGFATINLQSKYKANKNDLEQVCKDLHIDVLAMQI
jgi:hypothetical protein